MESKETDIDNCNCDERRPDLKKEERFRKQIKKLRDFWTGSAKTVFPVFRICVIGLKDVLEMEDLSFKGQSVRKERMRKLSMGVTTEEVEEEESGEGFWRMEVSDHGVDAEDQLDTVKEYEC